MGAPALLGSARGGVELIGAVVAGTSFGARVAGAGADVNWAGAALFRGTEVAAGTGAVAAGTAVGAYNPGDGTIAGRKA